MIETEVFWKGEFGDKYTLRNDGLDYGSGCFNFWSEVFGYMNNVNSVLEFGCNRGLNLDCINELNHGIQINAVEINKSAANLALSKGYKVNIGSISDEIPDDFSSDLTFTCGVLIHISPKLLDKVYKNLFKASKKYILISEYFSTNPEEILYRGHKSKMWKRDFASELWELFPSLKLVKYGFDWRYDKNRANNDHNWFLFSK